MDKLSLLNRLNYLYENNINVMQYLKTMNPDGQNNTEDILLSYDIQAGSYIEHYRTNPALKNDYCSHIGAIIDSLFPFNSILEVGVGEATTLGPLVKLLHKKPKNIYGFDLSWSRIKYAKAFLKELRISKDLLFVGDLFKTPFKDNSIDIVYTSHSIEPNGGKEVAALTELYRITKKYLILLEPSYELANQEARMRMEQHGYVKNIYGTAIELGYKVIEHRLFELTSNPLNPTGLTIIEKKSELSNTNTQPLCCPITKTSISLIKNTYFSKESMLAYPIVDGIPCLLAQQALVTSKMLD